MGDRLIWYNSNITQRTQNHRLAGMKAFSVFARFFSPTAAIIDRSSSLHIPLHVDVLFPLPKGKDIHKSYVEICHDRALAILAQVDARSVPLYVMWSGGVDSTLLLSLLLMHATEAQKKNITVLLTEESILENPRFYNTFIRSKLYTASAGLFPSILGTNKVIVWGNNNELLFGGRDMGSFAARFGFEMLHEPVQHTILADYYHERVESEGVQLQRGVQMLMRCKENAPVNIHSFQDFFWWVGFASKWQSCIMRPLSYVSPHTAHGMTTESVSTYVIPFYATDTFQLWSLYSSERSVKDSWMQYKKPARDIIYEYSKDDAYRDSHVSRDSLRSLLSYRSPALYINTQYRVSYDPDATPYYALHNHFNV